MTRYMSNLAHDRHQRWTLLRPKITFKATVARSGPTRHTARLTTVISGLLIRGSVHRSW